MNSQQRKFLIDKITEKTKAKIKELKNNIPELISLNTFMLHKVLSNDFQINSIENLREIIINRALQVSKSKEIREDWIGNAWGVANKKNVSFALDEFFIIPEDYKKIIEDRNKIAIEIEKQIKDLELHLDTLEIRIMLASDKTLQSMINDVDDMGDIKLIDTKIKLLN